MPIALCLIIIIAPILAACTLEFETFISAIVLLCVMAGLSVSRTDDRAGITRTQAVGSAADTDFSILSPQSVGRLHHCGAGISRRGENPVQRD